MVPAAHGTDGAGSIRIPASCCGVVGLKPSRGRTPSVFPGIAMNGLDSEHVLTRSVRDSEAFLAGTMDPIPADDALAARRATRLTGTRGALRIAWTAKPPFAGVAVDPACVAAAADAASLLRSLGHDVDEGAPAFDGEVLIEPFARVWAIANLEAHDDVAAFLRRRPRPDELEETTWELVEFARTLGSGALREARGRLDAAARDVAPFFERFDAWLTPTLARPPERLGVLNRSQGGAVEWWRFDCSFNPWNPMANMTGQPAISVPFSESADGLPIGVLLTAAVGDEPTLFRLAGQMEEARPWADRRPGIHAGGTPTGRGVTRG